MCERPSSTWQRCTSQSSWWARRVACGKSAVTAMRYRTTRNERSCQQRVHERISPTTSFSCDPGPPCTAPYSAARSLPFYDFAYAAGALNIQSVRFESGDSTRHSRRNDPEQRFYEKTMMVRRDRIRQDHPFTCTACRRAID